MMSPALGLCGWNCAVMDVVCRSDGCVLVEFVGGVGTPLSCFLLCIHSSALIRRWRRHGDKSKSLPARKGRGGLCETPPSLARQGTMVRTVVSSSGNIQME